MVPFFRSLFQNGFSLGQSAETYVAPVVYLDGCAQVPMPAGAVLTAVVST